MTFQIDTDYLYNNNISAQDYTIAYLYSRGMSSLNAYLKRYPIEEVTIQRLIDARFFAPIDRELAPSLENITMTEKFKKEFTINSDKFEDF
jgi:hypothetical protein